MFSALLVSWIINGGSCESPTFMRDEQLLTWRLCFCASCMWYQSAQSHEEPEGCRLNLYSHTSTIVALMLEWLRRLTLWACDA